MYTYPPLPHKNAVVLSFFPEELHQVNDPKKGKAAVKAVKSDINMKKLDALEKVLAGKKDKDVSRLFYLFRFF